MLLELQQILCNTNFFCGITACVLSKILLQTNGEPARKKIKLSSRDQWVMSCTCIANIQGRQCQCIVMLA